ncbi:shadow of prion protein 2 [Electrophorus electricus]|uniref:shadow of prion protein 2 n=1 Tax=Electrophorus electricus TaxID=8005 RepID=UPI0015D0A8D2|nr:shadow of prion protein 2 [Electrophorus electricus]
MVRRHQAMLVRDRLQLLCVCALLLASLCPGVSSKHGGFWGRGKGGGLGGRHAPMHNTGSSRAGMKIAGAAAAGAIGGAAIGYGLGSLGRPGYGYDHGYGWDPSNGNRRYHDRSEYYNSSDGRYYRGGASSGPALSMITTLGVALCILLW